MASLFFPQKGALSKLMATTENEQQLFGKPGTGQSQNPPGNGQGGDPNSGASVPGYVTMDQLRQALADERRATQSRLAKETNNRKKHLDNLKAQGVTVTPEQEREFMRIDVLASDDEPVASPVPVVQQPAPVPPQQATNVPAVSWKNESYMAIVEDLPPDQWLAEDDPEYRGLPATEDPGEFRKAIKKAIQDKKARLASGALGRLPAVPAGGKPSDLKAQFQKEMGELPRGDVDARGRLYAKYRALGFTDFS